ncbi:MAG: chaperonin GroEL [Anaerolineae bacterium]|nr:chaperonin GroEL [Anaerolineae bacterium]
MRKQRTREVVFQPRTYRGFQRGVNQIVAAIRPTLGPRPRIVAIQRILDQRMPEMLDNGGVIAQRIIQLPGRDEDVGAMFIRDMLWRLHDQVGDGTATAAVLFQAIYNEGVRYLTAGGDARRLHEFLQKGLEIILDQLSRMTVSASGKEQLAQIAESICYDPDLAKMMGEIFDIIGEYGRLEIRPGRGRELEREYVEGMYWERGLVSREMITDHSRARTEFENAAILISDLDIEQPQQLFPALEVALRAKIGTLLIVANKLSNSAIGFLLANKKPEQFQVMAVQTPGFGKEEQATALEDLAILTGGRPFIQVAGDTFEPIKVEHFGQARRIWADPRNFGIIGGKGDPRRLRQHIASLRAAYNGTEDTVLQGKLLSRIGKLLGGSATLWIGGATELEINERREVAERTAAAMRGAMMEGVMPGGGVALLACRPALQQRLDQAADTDERAAYQILLAALAVPLRTLVSNAGYDPSEVMAQINLAGPGYGFDVVAGRVVEMRQAGICDAAVVQKTAVYNAISSAALALTIDVLVHRNGQPEHAAVHTPGKRKRL